MEAEEAVEWRVFFKITSIIAGSTIATQSQTAMKRRKVVRSSNLLVFVVAVACAAVYIQGSGNGMPVLPELTFQTENSKTQPKLRTDLIELTELHEEPEALKDLKHDARTGIDNYAAVGLAKSVGDRLDRGPPGDASSDHQIYDSCASKKLQGYAFETFDKTRFLAWMRDPNSIGSVEDDDDFLRCSAFRFKELLRKDSRYMSQLDKRNGASSSSIPKAILHIGPKNSETGSIQKALRQYSKELLEENTIILGTNNRDNQLFVRCLMFDRIPKRQRDQCEELKNNRIFDNMKHKILEAREHHQNILLSGDALALISKLSVHKIKDVFNGFEIHVVVGYHRFFEWVVSRSLPTGYLFTEYLFLSTL